MLQHVYALPKGLLNALARRRIHLATVVHIILPKGLLMALARIRIHLATGVQLVRVLR